MKLFGIIAIVATLVLNGCTKKEIDLSKANPAIVMECAINLLNKFKKDGNDKVRRKICEWKGEKSAKCKLTREEVNNYLDEKLKSCVRDRS